MLPDISSGYRPTSPISMYGMDLLCVNLLLALFSLTCIALFSFRILLSQIFLRCVSVGVISALDIIGFIQMILRQTCNTLKWVISVEYTQKEVSTTYSVTATHRGDSRNVYLFILILNIPMQVKSDESHVLEGHNRYSKFCRNCFYVKACDPLWFGEVFVTGSQLSCLFPKVVLIC